MVKDLKKELSKLSGVDFFNPKYRDIFKKYFPDEEDAKSEEEKVENVDVVEEVETPVDNNVEERVEETTEEVKEEVPEDADGNFTREAVDVVDNEETENVVADETKEIVDSDDGDVEPVDTFNDNEVEEVVEPVDSAETLKDELLDTKIELALVRNGVRPERLDSAKKFAKYEINSLEELGKIDEILAEYPEWITGHKVENFGMTVDENSDNLTEEQKRLKEMGIDPN